MPITAAGPPELQLADCGVTHPRLWRWVRFEPPLRDAHAWAGARREVSCRTCGAWFGHSEDPVDALLVAWRHRRHMHR